MSYWLFQGNPNYYRMVDSICELSQISFPVTYHVKDILLDDKALIWVSGKQSGIYALAKVVQSAYSIDKLPEEEYWLDSQKAVQKQFVRVEFTKKLVDKPILKEFLKQDTLLQKLLVIRNPNRATYKVSLEEWEQINKIVQAQK